MDKWVFLINKMAKLILRPTSKVHNDVIKILS